MRRGGGAGFCCAPPVARCGEGECACEKDWRRVVTAPLRCVNEYTQVVSLGGGGGAQPTTNSDSHRITAEY